MDRLPLDPELDPDVSLILLYLASVDDGGRLEDIHALDPPERLRSLGECLGSRVPPGFVGDTHEVDGLDDGHASSSQAGSGCALGFYGDPTVGRQSAGAQ